MNDFTGGPWTIRGTDIGVVDKSDTQGHEMLDVITRVDHRGFQDQHKANANLISASPDMYEALKSVIMMVDANVIMVRPSDREAFLNALESWNQALAKADGEVL